MTVAFGVAGVAQVYLERRAGMEFLDVQRELQVHFVGLILAASIFTLGVIAFIYNFIRYGWPVGDVEELVSSGAAVAAPAE
jgi:nitric oxide reductase subunit B